MMQIAFYRVVKWFSLVSFLVVAGCSTTSKDFLNDKPPSTSENDNGFIWHGHRPFGKQKYTVSQKYKNTVWERLLSLYSLPELNNERIDRELNWYLRHPAYLSRVQQRAEPYLHLILDEIEAKDIPGELALLPIVESAFLPHAYSKSDASGLWQFIPATGRLYGLEQNLWYDGRRDVYASTKAATAFLKHLGETFDGDWHLALASYNYGKGNVRKAIEKNENLNLATDYWSLDLPKETADYVPRLLAVAKIFANPEKYHIDLHPIPNRPYCEVVDVKAQIDINRAAQLAEMPVNEFLHLNPGFNLSSTSPHGPHRLLIPTVKAQIFKQNLAQLPFDQWVDWQRYQAELAEQSKRTQDKTNTLAQRKAKSETADKSQLASIKGSARPVTAAVSPTMAKASDAKLAAVNMPKNSPGTQVYVVQKGDTLWSISQKFAVNDKDLARWNNMTAKPVAVLGQKLIIKAATQPVRVSAPRENFTPAVATAGRSISYTVKEGDSLAQISRKFNVTIADLRKWNSPEISTSLAPGKKLRVIINT